LDRHLFENIVKLLETDKYKERLEISLKSGRSVFTLNLRDLDEEPRRALENNFSAELHGRNNIHEEVMPKFNYIASTLGIEERFKELTILLEGVDKRRDIRQLTSGDIDTLMVVNGIVTSVTSPRSIITRAVFNCPRCGEETYIHQDSTELTKAEKCSGCNRKRGLTLNEIKSVWKDYQEVYLQELPDMVEAGVVPRIEKIRIIGKHLIDSCKPGDIIDMVGTLLPIPASRSRNPRVFNWCLQANNIEVLNKAAFDVELTEEDTFELINLSKHPRIKEIIINSIFPSIYGHRAEKYGIVFALFGGIDHKKPDITHRGTVNVLLVGDPSTAKSQMLLAAVNAAPKGIYTEARGASGVGLTAAAIQDQSGWRIEAGAIVLADRGVCCIDEIEKMGNDDRTKIHGAMANQMVRVDRADKHMTLNARTAIIAAANPTHGRYDPYMTLADNISLPSTILPRFDLIFIIKDQPNEERDRKLMEKILEVDNGEENSLPLINIGMVKKYILYSKTLKPILTEEAVRMIIDFYVEMRKISSKRNEWNTNPIAITVRQGEAIRRLAEASARMSLRSEVGKVDVELAIELMRETLEKAGYDPETGKLDAGIIETGKVKSKEDKKKLILRELEILGPDAAHIDVLADHLKNYMDKSEILSLLNQMDERVYRPRGNTEWWKKL